MWIISTSHVSPITLNSWECPHSTTYFILIIVGYGMNGQADYTRKIVAQGRSPIYTTVGEIMTDKVLFHTFLVTFNPLGKYQVQPASVLTRFKYLPSAGQINNSDI